MMTDEQLSPIWKNQEMQPYMTLDGYQVFTDETAVYPGSDERRSQAAINYCCLKVAGEGGEVADKWGKVLRDNNGELTNEMRFAIAKELGDTLWYIAQASKQIGFRLHQIATMNLEKLHDRKQRDQLKGSGDNR